MEAASDRSFLRMIRRSGQGRLKIYLGYAAGVGKTCRMLEEARRLAAEGIDVVVGVIDAHGRPGTAALLEGLERVPLARLEYRGVALEELNLPGVLQRRPRVVLIDELAHDNPPGSAHAKRYQDVQAILAEGIHVLSTLNVQHLESLYETVERAAGVRVRNRIPDLVLREADEIVNVDLAVQDLIQRVREGRVVAPDRVENALDHFFRHEGLEQLRELALRELASLLDFRRRSAEEDAPASGPADRLMVALGPRRGEHAALLRLASRLAGRLNRNWYAVHVRGHVPDDDPPLGEETERLANQLGALVFTLRGQDVAATLAEFASTYRVSHVVVGKPRRRPLARLWRASVLDALLRVGGFSVIAADRDPASERAPKDAASSAAPEPPRRPARLCEVLDPARILIFPEAVPRTHLLRSLAKAALDGSGVSPFAALKAVEEREAEASTTILNQGLGLPHAAFEGLPGLRAALGLPRAGVNGGRGEPLRMVLLTLYPPEDAERHLELLSQMSHAFQDAGLRAALASARGPEEAQAALRRWERGSADF